MPEANLPLPGQSMPETISAAFMPLKHPDQRNQVSTGVSPPLSRAATDDADGQSLTIVVMQQSTKDEQAQKSVDKSVGYGPDENFKLWRPLWLFKRTIVIFLVVFLACIAGLEIIYQLSERNQGLVSSTPDRHYLWTYGPTALFTVVTAFWTRVDYRVQQYAPWTAMSKGASPASKNVLLDYVGDFQPMVMYKAMREKHFDVGLSRFLSYSLSLLIVVSTGLISLNPVVVHNNDFRVQSLDSFADVALHEAEPTSSDRGPLSLTWGFQRLNLSYPRGTNDKTAFQTFNTSLVAPQSTIELLVDGLSVDWECENASLTKSTWMNETISRDSTASGLFDIVTDSCTVVDKQIKVHSADTTPLISFFHKFESGQCTNMSGPDNYQVILMAGRINVTACDYEEMLMNFSISDSFQKLCRPRYAISQYRLTRVPSASGQQSTVASLAGSNNHTLSQVPMANLSETFFSAIEIDYTGAFSYGNFSNYGGSTWSYVAAVHGIDEGHLTDQLLYERLCRSTYQTFLAQVAKQQMLKPEPVTLEGSARLTEDRLVVQSFIARSMEAILGLLTILVLLILLLVPSEGVVTRDHGSLIGMAAIMSLGRKLLQASPVADPNCSARRFQNNLIKTPVSVITEASKVASRQKIHSPTHEACYRPALIRHLILVTSFVVVCTVIVALEILLQVSMKRHGIVNANLTSYVRYTWSLIPATVMTGIKFYYSSVDFSAKVFAPFASLRKGAAYQRSMVVNFLDQMAIQSLWSAVRSRHTVVFFTTGAALVGTLLSIAVSGVYNVAETPFLQIVTLRQGNSLANQYFNATDGTNNRGALIAGLVLQAQLEYPAWTYEDLVFPPLYFDPDAPNLSMLNSANGTVHISLPAIRSKLSCRLIRSNEFLYDKNNNLSELSYLEVPITGCGDSPTVSIMLAVGDVPVSHDPWAKFVPPYDLADPRFHNCTYLNFVWGSPTDISKLTVMSCSEKIGVVHTDVNFVLPQFRVDESHPPLPDESTLRTFQRSSFDPRYDYLPTPGSPSGYDMDEFFQLLTGANNRLSMPADWLQEEGRIEDVQNAIMKLHGIIRAQEYVVANLSIPGTTSSSGEQTYTGTVTYGSRLRLVQNAPSTRILEGLLGAVALCTVIIIFTIRTKEILQQSPTSIAGMAGLLVDSNLLDKLPQGAEWMSDEQLAEVLGKYRFKLGWFRPDGGTSAGSSAEAGRSEDSIVEELTYGIYIEGQDGMHASNDGEVKDAPDEGQSPSGVELQNTNGDAGQNEEWNDTHTNNEEEKNEPAEEHYAVILQNAEHDDAGRDEQRNDTIANNEEAGKNEPDDEHSPVRLQNTEHGDPGRYEELDDTHANNAGEESNAPEKEHSPPASQVVENGNPGRNEERHDRTDHDETQNNQSAAISKNEADLRTETHCQQEDGTRSEHKIPSMGSQDDERQSSVSRHSSGDISVL